MARISPKSAVFWITACVAWCALVFWLSLAASPPRLKMPLLSWDKVQHASAYAVLTLFAGKSAGYLRPAWRHPWLLAGVFALIFGLLMEWLQYATGRGRLAEPLDVVADAAGIGLVLAVVGVRSRLGRRPGPSS